MRYFKAFSTTNCTSLSLNILWKNTANIFRLLDHTLCERVNCCSNSTYFGFWPFLLKLIADILLWGRESKFSDLLWSIYRSFFTRTNKHKKDSVMQSSFLKQWLGPLGGMIYKIQKQKRKYSTQNDIYFLSFSSFCFLTCELLDNLTFSGV